MKLRLNLSGVALGSTIALALALGACSSDDDDGGGGNVGGSSGKAGASGSSGKGGSGGGTAGGAGTGGKAGGGGTGGGDAQMAMVRVVHAAPTAGAVDVYVAGEATPVTGADDLAYGSATAWISVAPGALTFEIREGTAAATAAAAFTSPEVTLEAGKQYTLVAAGDLASTAVDKAFRVVVVDGEAAAPAATEVSARLVHAAYSAAAVDIDVSAADGVEVDDLAVFATTEALTLPAAQSLRLSLLNTAGDQTLTKLTTPELTGGQEVLLVATGLFGRRFDANGFGVMAVMNDGTTAWIKEDPWIGLVNASTSDTSRDVYLSTATAATDLLVDDAGYGTIRQFQVPPSAAGHTLNFVANDAPNGTGSGATGATGAVAAGEHYLAVTVASAANFALLVAQENMDVSKTDMVQLRGVHASQQQEKTVDFGVAAGAVLVSGLVDDVAQKSVSQMAAELTAGDSILGAATAETIPVLLDSVTWTATAGTRAFVVLADDDAPATTPEPPAAVWIADLTTRPFMLTQ
jgi:hypothetical protein